MAKDGERVVVEKNEMKAKSYMVWIDLEMTGLDPEKQRIIEIASVVTDDNLSPVAEGPHLVIHQPPRVIASMDTWSKKQHAKTGLTEEVIRSKVSLKEAEKKTLAFLEKNCFPQASPLCGNTVHHDRRFLIKYMPKVHDFLHYRHVDVSTIKDLVARWYPNDKAFLKKKDSHRALADILESIEELKFYREKYFRTQDSSG